jgi:hypothetical protein
MAGNYWVMVSILILIVILGVMAIILAKDRKKKGPDYYTMFLIGLIWVPVGIFMQWKGDSPVFWLLGLIFLVIGLCHKKEWKRNHVKFSKLPKAQKRSTIILILVLALVLLIGIGIYCLKSCGLA